MEANSRADRLNLAEKVLSDEGESERAELASNIQEITNDLKFPVSSFEELIKKIGNRKIAIAGVTISAEDGSKLKRIIPSNLFPIQNRQDLLEKAASIFFLERMRYQNAKDKAIPQKPLKLVEPVSADQIPPEFRNLPRKTPKLPKGLHGSTGILMRMDD